KEAAADTARSYAGSITLGVGQFCTNPGLIIGVDNSDLKVFIDTLSEEITKVPPATMLNTGIFKNYVERRANAISQEEVETAAVSSKDPQMDEGAATVATVPAAVFMTNPILHQEVFGPYSLVVKCADMLEMLEVTKHLEGQLTATLMATETDILENDLLVEAVKNICGRFILNGVPTGVEVCLSMQHGGPFPSTTDSRFTSVGADGIKRFARPIAFQNWPDNLLPPELQNANPLQISRIVNDKRSEAPL
ncbi:MAG: aldehyde dehydrogenase family protein, partial [Chitinophagaceae bacterium]|nr:aldehyde dehydrogenase family protein [Chitinophagaceae bacterium]